MKNIRKIIIVAAAIIVMVMGGCGRKIVPAEIAVNNQEDYDTIAYNYLFVEGIKNKLLGNFGDALENFENSVEIEPESDASYYQMAQIMMEMGDLENAKRYAAKAHNLDEDNLWYIMMLAGIYYQQRDIDSAIIYYEKGAEKFPERDNLKLTLGNLYMDKGDFGRAGKMFEELDEKLGVNEVTTVGNIRSLIESGKYNEALEKTEKLIDNFPDEILYKGMEAEIYREKGESEKALEIYYNVLERNPDSPETQLGLCDFLIDEGRQEELFSLLNRVILNERIIREDKISLLSEIIESEDIGEEYEDKMIILLMILEANYENDDIILLLRPEFLIKRGEFNEAAEKLEEIIDENRDNYYAWEKLLLLYLEMGDYDMLMERGKECSVRFNRSYLAKVLYAQGAIEKEEYSIALGELEKAQILAGNNKELVIQVLGMKADIYYRMKDYSKAFEIFEDALKEDNGDIIIMNNYAYYMAEQNVNLKQAQELAERVIAEEGDNTTYLDTYAWVLYRRGKIKEAARIMESVIENSDKDDAEWLEHYGYILKEMKRCEEAIENWNRAIEIDNTKIHLMKEIENCR